MKGRIDMDINVEFEKMFGAAPVAVAAAPGRLEVLGNHTDYNDGLVLSAAARMRTTFAVIPTEGDECEVATTSFGGSVERFSLRALLESRDAGGGWSAYVKGMMLELDARGVDLGAFNALIDSDIPLSAGMSSSAALEISTGFALGAAFGAELAKEDWARAGQAVENKHMGLQSGLLDQFSSIFGEKNKLILCDFRDVVVEGTIPMPENLVFVVANSMVKHDLVDSDYNVRRESCERVVALLKEKKGMEISALRDVSTAELEAAGNAIPIQDLRIASHVTGENERVRAGVDALKSGDAEAFGRLMYESHESSIHNFANSCPELDCLVELSKSIPGCLGARLSGGGFGGISIHLVEADEAETYRKRLETAYLREMGKETTTLVCPIGGGASVLREP
jgi:galactokinase